MNALAVVALLPVDLDDARDCVRHVALTHRRPDDLSERGESVDRAAKRDLVPLLAVLVDAENANVSDVMMAAGVHAARHLDLDVAQVVEIVEIVEALLDLLGHIESSGIGERAEIQPRTGDHVGERADVGKRQAELVQLPATVRADPAGARLRAAGSGCGWRAQARNCSDPRGRRPHPSAPRSCRPGMSPCALSEMKATR